MENQTNQPELNVDAAVDRKHSLQSFRLDVVIEPQIKLVHVPCGEGCQMMKVQNTQDLTKPANAVLMCHTCKVSEMIDLVTWDKLVERVQKTAVPAN